MRLRDARDCHLRRAPAAHAACGLRARATCRECPLWPNSKLMYTSCIYHAVRWVYANPRFPAGCRIPGAARIKVELLSLVRAQCRER
eukprot:scaffold33574_cov67-Phaeocystis_antarctica.AAC.3